MPRLLGGPRRYQNEILGHRGQADRLYRARKLLGLARERLDEKCTRQPAGLLVAGDSRRGVPPVARQGSRSKTLRTPRADDVELKIPKLRKCSLFPELLEARHHVDRAPWAVS